MIRTVIKTDLNVRHGKTCQNTTIHRLFNAFFNRRNKFVRDNAAFNQIVEFKTFAALHWFQFQPNMAVLAAAA